jgi:transcriptional regulator with XRE-family HTH domain
MRIDAALTDETILQELGERLPGVRLARNPTQQELADQAGLGLRTIQRMESGQSATHLSGLVRVCRVLGLTDNLENLLPEQGISPIARLKVQSGRRQRASGTRKPAKPPKNWTWGETS